jgi:hypothetical protein
MGITLSLSGQRWADPNHHLITLYCLLYIIITTTVLSFLFSLYDSCILHPRRILIILSSQYTTILTLCFVFCQICFGGYLLIHHQIHVIFLTLAGDSRLALLYWLNLGNPKYNY